MKISAHLAAAICIIGICIACKTTGNVSEVRDVAATSADQVMPGSTSQQDSATVYYVSNSGDDSAAGTTPQTSWRTLGKVSATLFKPGDSILLKRGDRWVGENLRPKGAGSPDHWITVSAYGDGPENPKIWPGATMPSVIQLGDEQNDGDGGWRFKELDLGYANAGLVFVNNAKAPNGLWIENCFFHATSGLALFSVSYMYYSTAILIHNPRGDGQKRLSNLTIKNVTVDGSDSPLHVLGVNHLVIDNFSSLSSHRVGALLEQVEDGDVRNIHILNSGTDLGMWWGVAGLQFNQCTKVTVTDSEVAFTHKPDSPDGVGIDFEGSNTDVTVQNSKIHDNAGPGALVFRNSVWGVDNIRTNIVNCTFSHNGLDDPDNLPAFLDHYLNYQDGGTIKGNIIVKVRPSQALNRIDKTLTTAWPSSYVIEGNSER